MGCCGCPNCRGADPMSTLKFKRKHVTLYVGQYSDDKLSANVGSDVRMYVAASAPIDECVIQNGGLFIGDAIFHVTSRESKAIQKTFGVRSCTSA